MGASIRTHVPATVSVDAGQISVSMSLPIELYGTTDSVEPVDVRSLVLEWLQAQNPGAIEQLVLSEFDDQTMTTGQAFLAALMKVARGE